MDLRKWSLSDCRWKDLKIALIFLLVQYSLKHEISYCWECQTPLLETFWFIFNVPTKCNCPWMSLKCSSSSVLRMWTKKKRIFCNFPSTFLKPVEKIVPAYIYICLFLYLPICLLSILFIDSVDDRCLFAYFYICNNCKVWISYCHKFILTPVSSPCCVQKVKKTFAPIICKIVKVENAPLSNYLGNSTFF